MAEPLFRHQALAFKQQRLLGEVNLSQPRHVTVIFVTLVLLLGMVLSLLLFTDLHRKERVRGKLVPSGGTIHMMSDVTGIVVSIHVREGETVLPGQALVSIEKPHHYGVGQTLQQQSLRSIQERLDFLEQALLENQLLLDSELANGAQRQTALKAELNNLHTQKRLLRRRAALQETRLATFKSLGAEDHVAKFDVIRNEDALLGLHQLETELDQKILNLGQELRSVEVEQEQIPLRHRSTMRALKDQQLVLGLDLEQTRAAILSVVTASRTGTVTTVQVNSGQHVAPGDALLSMHPEHTSLVADLYLPSSAIGLVRVGNQVNLRLDAFPYQRFGQLEGEIVQIDQSLLRPDRHLQMGNEPRYRVRAGLNRQTLTGKGDTHQLKAGMVVEADILLEKRRLFDWFLEPFLGFSERLG